MGPGEALLSAADGGAPDRGARAIGGVRSGATPTISPRSCGERETALPGATAEGRPHHGEFDDVAGLGWQLPRRRSRGGVDALLDAIARRRDPEQLGRALAYAAALRIMRFHVQNDFGDWDTVHHAFTAANALHQALVRDADARADRAASCTARCASTSTGSSTCPPRACPTSRLGRPRRARASAGRSRAASTTPAAIASGYLRGGGDPAPSSSRRSVTRCCAEDAEFHWYQVFEAGGPPSHCVARGLRGGRARSSPASPASSPPTRRPGVSCPVVDIATRLRRGEDLYEES